MPEAVVDQITTEEVQGAAPGMAAAEGAAPAPIMSAAREMAQVAGAAPEMVPSLKASVETPEEEDSGGGID